ncbi:MAG: ATP-dependent DNA helicase RecG [Chloroflexi bacterium]|nr:ATP-dependent DNA helicase RecG [Chloroflexota bacterium]
MSVPESPARPSPSLLDTLEKVLHLEEQRHYDDRSVVGGLAAFVKRSGDQLSLGVALRDRVGAYGRQTADERAAVVAELRNFMRDVIRHPPAAAPAGPRATSPRTTDTGSRGRTDRTLDPATPIAALPGVGPTRAKRLAALEITTVGDLRSHLPHRYVAYPAPQPAATLGFQHVASFEGTVRQVDLAPLPGKRFRITAILADSTGAVAAVWIRAGGVPSGIRQGARLAVSGPLVAYGRQITFENPEYEPASAPPLNTRRTVPVYPLTAGLSQPAMRAIVRRGIEALPPAEEWLPDWLRDAEGLIGRDEALLQLHMPETEEKLQRARERYAFDELLPIQLLVLQRRLAYRSRSAQMIDVPWKLLAEFRQRLPFALTAAQQRALSTILDDMGRSRPMVRLLQGEVGSGKTVVAAMALLAAVASGGQVALVAPTEILAEQHFRTLTRLYEGSQSALEGILGGPLRLSLLTGALSRTDRQRTLAAIAAAEVNVVIGTHAVIQPDVEFARLSLAVVDEQHRFGVSQRVAARRKGENPHLLVMTATPIPRTLALTLYGDLDFSLIDELPPGRQPVETSLLRPLARNSAYERVRAEVAAGRQAFIICPLVEGSPSVEARAATTEYDRLQRRELAGLRLALLHGRMRPLEKDETMRRFATGDSDVLVSTSVVEVGVDVPNATVMVIEGAEHFGLAQLHQFRGRVGRSGYQASCFLIAGSEAPESLERLDAVARSTSGLDLAEEDLRIRGPGEYFGLRQSGFPSLRVARVSDLAFVQRVRHAAESILEVDPTLSRTEHASLAEAARHLGEDAGEAN